MLLKGIHVISGHFLQCCLSVKQVFQHQFYCRKQFISKHLSCFYLYFCFKSPGLLTSSYLSVFQNVFIVCVKCLNCQYVIVEWHWIGSLAVLMCHKNILSYLPTQPCQTSDSQQLSFFVVHYGLSSSQHRRRTLFIPAIFGGPQNLQSPQKGCQIVCSKSVSAGTVNYRYVTETFF